MGGAASSAFPRPPARTLPACPPPEAHSCHLPGHAGLQDRWTASPLNFNPEQLDGQRAPQATSLSAPPVEGVRGLPLWTQGGK